MSSTAEPGKVFLVGAGPGSPDLITLRGLRLIRSADVLVYDRLVHSDLLAEAPATAELVYVGKAPGEHSCPQETIHELLVEAARRGGIVVRLKGGDPFVFGRGGEECLALLEAGIPFEVVPGITSAVSVPAFAGIPVTHRKIATAFTVVTGHTCGEGDGQDWAALARAGTLVILMGLSRLPQIARDLVEHGCSAETPAAVIQCGTTDAQRVVTGTLATIAEQARGLRNPATIVVGDVVALRPELSWFTPAPADATDSAGALSSREALRRDGHAPAFAPAPPYASPNSVAGAPHRHS